MASLRFISNDVENLWPQPYTEVTLLDEKRQWHRVLLRFVMVLVEKVVRVRKINLNFLNFVNLTIFFIKLYILFN